MGKRIRHPKKIKKESIQSPNMLKLEKNKEKNVPQHFVLEVHDAYLSSKTNLGR